MCGDKQKNWSHLRDTHKFKRGDEDEKERNEDLFHNRNLIIDIVVGILVTLHSFIWLISCCCRCLCCMPLIFDRNRFPIPFEILIFVSLVFFFWMLLLLLCFGRWRCWCSTYLNLIYLRIHELRQFRIFFLLYVGTSSDHFGPRISFFIWYLCFFPWFLFWYIINSFAFIHLASHIHAH